MSEELKREAAARAIEDVRPGMRLGLGTGSTAKHFVDLLGAKVAEGFEVICVPTSEVTARQAESLGIPLSDLDTLGQLDLTVDGADEIDYSFNLIKGGGGALLREKIVAAASTAMIVIADSSKLVETLGRFPLPIEGEPFVTDGGHLILDAFFGRISQPEALSRDLLDIPGVVQHGLFLNMCSKAYVAAPDGVKTLLKGA
jgi:ribose 5-phosphate isomerase A